MCGIYKITNKTNGKVYIGQSISIEDRWKKEKSRAFQPSSNSYESLLSRAIRKYGVENFDFEVLEECSKERLDELEQYYIAKYDSYFNGYNSTTGGNNGNANNCVKISKEQLLEIYDLLLNSTISQKDIAIKFQVGQDVISTINHGKSRRMDGYQYPLRGKKENRCIDCGIVISKGATRCSVCEKKSQRKVERPTREELKQLIRSKSFVSIGQQYGVNDNTIRKWCDNYNLPRKKSIIKALSDKEWALI